MSIGEEIFVYYLTWPVAFGSGWFQHELDTDKIRFYRAENGIAHVTAVVAKEEHLFAFHPVFKGPPGQLEIRRKALLNEGLGGVGYPVVTTEERLHDVEERKR